MEVLRGTWGWSHVPWPSGFVPWSSSEEKANFHSAKWESGSQTCNLKCLHFRVKAVRSRPVRRLLPDGGRERICNCSFLQELLYKGCRLFTTYAVLAKTVVLEGEQVKGGVLTDCCQASTGLRRESWSPIRWENHGFHDHKIPGNSGGSGFRQ